MSGGNKADPIQQAVEPFIEAASLNPARLLARVEPLVHPAAPAGCRRAFNRLNGPLLHP